MRGPNLARVTGRAEGLVPSTVLFRCPRSAHPRSAEGRQDNGEQPLWQARPSRTDSWRRHCHRIRSQLSVNDSLMTASVKG